MGFWRNFFGLDLPAPEVDPDSAPTFTGYDELVGGAEIDPAVFGLEAYAAPTSPSPRIDRRSAIQVPGVKRSRDLIPGVLGQLPLVQYNADNQRVPNPFLEQPERNVPRSVTMTRLFEDMFFEKVGWIRVTERTWDDWPLHGKQLHPSRVNVDEKSGAVYIDGQRVTDPDRELIRFDSPTDGLLTAGARAIRTALALLSYAGNAAQGLPPLDYFTPADGEDDPFDDPDDIEVANPYTAEDFLADWAKARRSRTTAWIPRNVQYHAAGFDPKALQMAEQFEAATLQIALTAGVDPEELGVSTTSRTYANQFDRRKNFTDFTLGLYRQAFEDRMKMPDITPRGHTVQLDLDAFLRSDPKSRFEAYRAGLEVGAYADKDEVRQLEGKPPLTAAQKRAAAPAVPAPESPDAPASVTPLRSVQ